MKLLIDIDKDDYRNIQEKEYVKTGLTSTLAKAIINGTIVDQRGEIQNLMIDMVMAGCTEEEMRRVIVYSLSVLDANKSFKENGIKDLIDKYQGEEN